MLVSWSTVRQFVPILILSIAAAGVALLTVRNSKERLTSRRRKTRRRRGRDTNASGGGGWMDGHLTYYWADEPELGYGTGSRGANGKELQAMVSVAVKGKAAFDKYNGRGVEIQGMGGRFRVDDYCLGAGCKEIDLYVGKKQGGHDGVKPIRYRFL